MKSFVKSRPYVLGVTGLALFAMFFGAGNLIFPVMIGVESGTSLTPALVGFLIAGVALPMLGMLAAATSTEGVSGIASRIGHWPGAVFTLMIFLATGMLYGIPRVATVSYELGVVPLLPQGSNKLALFLYTLVFFGLIYALALDPRGFVSRIGVWLTPALLVLLAALIVSAVIHLDFIGGPPQGEYESSPMTTGLLQGYFTMDAVASLVFGIVVIESLRHNGFTTKRQVFGGTALSSIGAGVALVLVYLGLATVGSRIADHAPSNGAEGLAYAAETLFGPAGQVIFGLIAILACMTTAVGLVGASTQYFRGLFPQISRPVIMGINVLIALLLANLGLEAMLKVVSPLNQFLYPVVICVIVVSLFDVAVPGQLKWTYRLTAWLGAFVGLFEALWSTNLPVFASLRGPLDLLPLGTVHIPWFLPSLIGFALGLIVDSVQNPTLWKRKAQNVPAQPVSDPADSAQLPQSSRSAASAQQPVNS